MVLNELMDAIQQILLFSLIPFAVYFIRKKKVKGFMDYIGLKGSNTKANLLALLVLFLIASPIVILMFANPEMAEVMKNPETVTGKIRAIESRPLAILMILIMAILKTSLSEEIFFRGFVAKRLIAITNFQIGNTIQAIIFGLIHSLLFLVITDNILFLVLIFLVPAIGAYCKTYLNEKVADGSIIPGWIAHGGANLISYSLVAFAL